MKELLKLVKYELIKLRRRRFVQLVAVAAALFPIPFTMMVMGESVGKANQFDLLFEQLVELGFPIMLPIVLGIIASMLVFMERDYGTMKNLLTIPLSTNQIIIPKIITLFIFGVLFSVITLVAAIVGGIVAGGVIRGIGHKMFIACATGLFYTVATLPVVAVVVCFHKTYIASIVFTFAYTMVNFYMAYTGQFTTIYASNKIIQALATISPTCVILRWHLLEFPPYAEYYEQWQPYFISFWMLVLIMAIITVLFGGIITKIYNEKERW